MMKIFDSSVKMDPTWTGRRRVVAVSLVSVIGLTAYAISAKNDPAATALITLWGWIVTNYLGWPTVERINGIPSQTKRINDNPIKSIETS